MRLKWKFRFCNSVWMLVHHNNLVLYLKDRHILKGLGTEKNTFKMFSRGDIIGQSSGLPRCNGRWKKYRAFLAMSANFFFTEERCCRENSIKKDVSASLLHRGLCRWVWLTDWLSSEGGLGHCITLGCPLSRGKLPKHESIFIWDIVWGYFGAISKVRI